MINALPPSTKPQAGARLVMTTFPSPTNSLSPQGRGSG
jgi:hypothetical protein